VHLGHCSSRSVYSYICGYVLKYLVEYMVPHDISTTYIPLQRVDLSKLIHLCELMEVWFVRYWLQYSCHIYDNYISGHGFEYIGIIAVVTYSLQQYLK
jgi:hypothetical protein